MRRGSQVVVELARLGIVLLFTALGFALAPWITDLANASDEEPVRLISSVLGALIGYLVGGTVGRLFVQGVDQASKRLETVEASTLIAGVIGGTVTGLFGMLLLWPVLLLPARQFTIPAAMLVLFTLIYAGVRVGSHRGGDLLRFVGARGRLQVSSPSRGGGTKVVDTSALIDGRLVDVARAGFLEGTLVVPRFVLGEMQAFADVEDPQKRSAARRGLDALRMLQDEALVAVEIADVEVPGVTEVDAKLTALCRDRDSTLLTVDSNLARVAEISGVRILNLHGLAEAMRPPAVPGDSLRVQIVKPGRERGQGVGYLPDGTMVVIERASDLQGEWVTADVTSIVQNRMGRMLFASLTGGEKGT